MPRTKVHEKRVRLNLNTSEKLRKRMEALRKRTEAESITEVIRKAIDCYEAVVLTGVVLK